MSASPATRGAAILSLAVVLAATVATLTVGAVIKEPCAAGDWSDGRQYRRLCYSDIVPLYGTEHLTGGRLPYLDRCPQSAGEQCDEYPVLTMYFMRLAAWLSFSHMYAAFFYANAVLLGLLALVTAWALYRMAGERALYFALAPTLLIYAFVNWDLLAVALATVGTLLYLRSRHRLSGVALGLGAAAKLYPALFLVPFALGRLRKGRRKDAAGLVLWTVIAYAAVNLPFVVAAFRPWTTFFKFNTHRPVDWDSLWFVACQRLHGTPNCSWSPHLMDTLSILIFAAVAAGLYLARWAVAPDFPRWTFGFPLLVVFLLTNKVYSPQYGLWLLPWFALALPNPWFFAMFEAADVAVFLTRFTWFGRLSADLGSPEFAGYRGTPLGGFEVAVVIRALILVGCLVAWVLQREPERVLIPPAARPAAGPAGDTARPRPP